MLRLLWRRLPLQRLRLREAVCRHVRHAAFICCTIMRFAGTEIFAIPSGLDVGMNDNEAVSIVYAPLRDEVAMVSSTDAEQLLQYYNGGVLPADEELRALISDMDSPEVEASAVTCPDINKSAKLSLLPNLTCNFACSYCYSAAGRGATVIPWEKVQAVLDRFIDETRIPPQQISIFISGGGEPLLSWNIVGRAVTYARKRASAKGFSLQISIVTNGSLLTEEIADFALENDCSLCVSFEVLPQLQNLQRRNFDLVNENIAMLGRKGVRTLLNSTITPQSVGFLCDMVKSVAERYPFVAQYTVEPVTGASAFGSAEALRRFYEDFYDGYTAAKRIAEGCGLTLRFTFDDALRGVSVRHCPGKFCLTPQGDISICHLVSSPAESRYDDCIYGRVKDDGSVEVDIEKFRVLYGKNIFSREQCRDCFAKWSCGGECMTRNETYPAEYMEEVCRFNRRFVKHLLLERLARCVKDETGMSLEEYVRQ